MRARLRNLFPPSGRPYELLDSALLLVAVGLFAYVIAPAPATTVSALRAPLEVLTEMQVGGLIVLAGLVGVICSYLAHPALHVPTVTRCLALRIGYAAVMLAPLVLSVWFAVGAATTDSGTRPIGQAVLYGYVFRQVWRANRREAEQTEIA